MNYHRIYQNDMVNGEGVRTTLFVSGCIHACEGCYNKSTWRPDSGVPFTRDTLEEIIKTLEPSHIAGLSLTGGDPLYYGNLGDIFAIIEAVRATYGKRKNIWLWSGFTLDEINADQSDEGLCRQTIVGMVDVFIDGKFEQDKHEHGLPFRGSTNQIIHRFTEF